MWPWRCTVDCGRRRRRRRCGCAAVSPVMEWPLPSLSGHAWVRRVRHARQPGSAAEVVLDPLSASPPRSARADLDLSQRRQPSCLRPRLLATSMPDSLSVALSSTAVDERRSTAPFAPSASPLPLRWTSGRTGQWTTSRPTRWTHRSSSPLTSLTPHPSSCSSPHTPSRTEERSTSLPSVTAHLLQLLLPSPLSSSHGGDVDNSASRASLSLVLPSLTADLPSARCRRCRRSVLLSSLVAALGYTWAASAAPCAASTWRRRSVATAPWWR